MKNKTNNKIQVFCCYCGVELLLKPYDYNRSKSKQFCCSWEHYKRFKQIEMQCEVCGRRFIKAKSDLKIKNRGRFCSRSCRGKTLSKGRNNPMWGSGKYTDGAGYIWIYVPEHPNNVNGYVREHRIVLEKKIGRYLTDKEVAHHINGIKNDNRVENISLMTSSSHATYHNNICWKHS